LQRSPSASRGWGFDMTYRITPEQWFNKSDQDQLRYLEMREHERRMQNQAQYEAWLKKPLPGQPPWWDTAILSSPLYPETPQPEPKRTTGMNYSTAIFLINNNVRALRGTYQSSRLSIPRSKRMTWWSSPPARGT
jgi:antibiotic biosynthesis monooxygenase (ABM) superfamily enzyme